MGTFLSSLTKASICCLYTLEFCYTFVVADCKYVMCRITTRKKLTSSQAQNCRSNTALTSHIKLMIIAPLFEALLFFYESYYC